MVTPEEIISYKPRGYSFTYFSFLGGEEVSNFADWNHIAVKQPPWPVIVSFKHENFRPIP